MPQTFMGMDPNAAAVETLLDGGTDEEYGSVVTVQADADGTIRSIVVELNDERIVAVSCRIALVDIATEQVACEWCQRGYRITKAGRDALDFYARKGGRPFYQGAAR